VIKPVMDTEDDAENDRALPIGSGGSKASPADRRTSEESQYTPYAVREGLYRRGWENYFQMLTHYWQPYLEGQVTFDDAIGIWFPPSKNAQIPLDNRHSGPEATCFFDGK